ncbi:Transcriptional regulatory protein DegU (plasmid) [Sulfitobacter sp. THAF37]|uniref:response regulator n=1 Tax=Sulfitobacter sp. THAF37 TaxID=2587855 RepID=UPI001267F0E9|nr:response regulator transcription factor [Sulfitobacter sp. THAF37]QFT60850.1 Transcriptional regulatory protein DegU [Sulfitobacter sp. THAF37]
MLTRPTHTPNLASAGTLQGWALVVDDHPLFCDALELTLRSVGNFADVATANSLDAALKTIKGAPPPALILLDLNLPDVNGFDGLMRLGRAAEEVPIIIVSSMAENSIIGNAIVAGARGFVPKHSPRSVFRDALNAIAAGNVYKPAGYVEGRGSEGRHENLTRLSSLTNQQARILELICEGKLNKQIAFDLSIAETTVKAHVTAIMRKLGVQSRTQAVLVAQDARYAKDLPTPE